MVFLAFQTALHACRTMMSQFAVEMKKNQSALERYRALIDCNRFAAVATILKLPRVKGILTAKTIRIAFLTVDRHCFLQPEMNDTYLCRFWVMEH